MKNLSTDKLIAIDDIAIKLIAIMTPKSLLAFPMADYIGRCNI